MLVYKLSDFYKTHFKFILLLLLLGLAFMAWSNRFIQDDAFISFRYADNFVQGNGLVWNPGEKVEGYTNFLWTILISIPLYLIVSSICVFYGLANRQLITEGKKVFATLQNEGIGAGRSRLSRIVGRDTTSLSSQQIRIAVMETMSENLGDGVIAPLFWYAIAGAPGMLTYKMVNTLDSMIGYRNERYEQFGKFAARLDDLANFIPARLTALLMVIVTASRKGAGFAVRYGHLHKSPNAGYPEAALAGILDLRFGGPNRYHGVLVDKPYIGHNDREIATEEISAVVGINQRVCLLMVILVMVFVLKF